mgnify:CR=1 FL=1
MVKKNIKKILKNKKLSFLVLLAVIIPLTSIALTYGIVKTAKDVTTITKGVAGDTVYIDDLNSDYYYYTGQNYTQSTNGTLPTLTNKNYYNDQNLVKVTITYDGTDYNSKKTGYVSLTERQSKFVYYKYYPVEDDYITISLIDNPFDDHPNDLVFNGWITDYQGATVSLDDTYYTREVKVPITYTGNMPNEINITMYASWTKGAVALLDGNNFDNAFDNLKEEGMNEITTTNDIYEYPDVAGYYKKEVITTVTTVISSGIFNTESETNYATCSNCYDSSGNYYDQNSEYQCPAPSLGWFPSTGDHTNDCDTYILQTEDDEYDPSATYYTRRNGRWVEADLEPIYVGSEEGEDFNENTNMAGYYRQVQIPYNTSVTGYYDETGTIQSGTCSSRYGCNYYELIQFYNQDGTEELFDKNQTYYYLTTRDTNLIVMTNDVSTSWDQNNDKPFTLTGIYNDVDYNPTWTVSNTAVTCYNDTRIEELTIATRTSNSNSNPTSSSGTRGVFYGNYQNAKLGRNINQNGNYVNFNSIIGGMNSTSSWGSSGTVGSTSNPEKYKLQIESGNYNSTSLTYGASTSTRSTILYTEMYGIYGNDYDRATENNENLVVYFCASGSWSGRIHSSNDTVIPALNTIVKSGSFGTSKYDLTTGIYVGGRYGGTHYAPRLAKIEGGYIYNLNGGPLTDENKDDTNDTYIYMTGGSVDIIIGGAGTTTTYGNRILQITGGTVNYSVFGGSNGSDGTSSDGSISGDSYVYIGGTATIGNDEYINNESTLWGAESGSVFGAGNGNTRSTAIGSVDNSNVIINDQALIKKNVYGSGNYGTVGYNASSISRTNIQILGGTVNGSVFGSGNQSGSGRNNSVESEINVSMSGGTVTDSIHGGSNQSGTVYGNVIIDLSGGTAQNVYGGGLGSNTYVTQDVTVNTGQNADNLNITGDLYGGSAYGTVNSSSKNNNVSRYQTTVNIKGGTIKNVFGGGRGNSSNTPYVAGNVTLTIDGGTIESAYGGNNASGEPNGEVNVYLNGGTIKNVYGGGNNTSVTNTHVYQNNAIVTNLFGGSNSSGNVETSSVTVNGGQTEKLFGGNNVGGQTKSSHVLIASGEIETAYGGGNLVDTNDTTVEVSGGAVNNLYGGGESANIIEDTTINVTGGEIGYLYGGSNILGDVPKTNITVNGGNQTEIYGGNNQGGKADTTTVTLNGGTPHTVYGGGNKVSTTTTNVTLNGSSAENIYGGGNQAGVETTNITLITGNSNNVFGGSNNSGSVTKSNITSANPQNLYVTTIYGGNNQGGVTGQTNITLNGGTYTNIYGGGNLTPTDRTKVDVDSITMTGQFYGGGNQAEVNYSTDVDFKNSSITGDLYGGGNLGAVHGNTDVYISASHIQSSAYAGGNGQSAIVYGNTKLDIDNNSVIDKHVFGGGNAANTGTEENDDSTSEVNIAGATINGNVYGGANTAVLYGTVSLDIGYDQDNLVKSDIIIKGTVFGGGEANAAGDPDYDYSFISVTKGIDINIDGKDYQNFSISGSIFGSGNASSTEGYSYIDISNYGTFDNYKENISIQRADIVTIKNSAIKLSGTTDRTNEFSTTEFSISRVKELKLANNSTLFLENGTNLLEKFTSIKIDGNRETKAEVTIDDDGKTTRNVNNRIYMLESKNLNIATNEAVTGYGTVSGMTFFGMFQKDRNDRVLTAFYDNSYENGDEVEPGEFYTFTSGSYVLGLHKSNHDITKDGFYSNYENEDQPGTIQTKYIEPTPSDASYYMWVIGEEVTTYDINLTASRYATLGTYELPLITSNGANTTFEIIGFNYQNLEEDFELINPDDVERINTEGTADTKMALKMENPNTGFITNGSTAFLTSEDSISGTTDYITENSNSVPSFIFYLYHSKNITEAREIGTVVISLLAITPVDELNNEVTRININVTLNSALYDDDEYEGAMTSGKKDEMFASTSTNITTSSTLSAYYSLYMESKSPYYKNGYHHSLVSNYVLPENTKITMIDLSNTPTYYYHIISSEDVEKATDEYERYGECSYDLRDFIVMGSTSADNLYDETQNNSRYYNQELGIVEEEFIFNVDFEEANITGDKLSNTLLMELRNQDNQTLISVLGIQHASLTYNLYDNQNAIIDITGNLSNSNLYSGDSTNLNLTTNFTQPSIGSLPIIDTTYLDKKTGIRLTILDSNNQTLNSNSLLGLSYEVNGTTYYPRMDGSVRLPLADRVANLSSKIKINTGTANLPSGNYTLKIESFGSPDGIYYGLSPSDTLELPFTVTNSRYGLDVKLPDTQIIIDKKTGLTEENNNALDFQTNYSSAFINPSIRVSLYRRNYNSVYDNTYTKVKLTDYVTNNTEEISDGEYMFINNPNITKEKTLYLRQTLISGTYKFVFSLYDGDVYIGSSQEYVIIK